MKLYLASRFQDIQHIRSVRDRLEGLGGTEITATWLDQGEDKNMATIKDRFQECRDVAMRDIHDIAAADVVVVFSPPSAHGTGTGGRHVECGIAIATGKPVVLVGERENVFHYHPSVIRVRTEDEILETAQLWHACLKKGGPCPSTTG